MGTVLYRNHAVFPFTVPSDVHATGTVRGVVRVLQRPPTNISENATGTVRIANAMKYTRLDLYAKFII